MRTRDVQILRYLNIGQDMGIFYVHNFDSFPIHKFKHML